MALDMFSLHDRKALVTGGSQGLGRAMAEALLEAGAEVGIIDISPATDAAVAEMTRNGGTAHAVTGDLLDRDSRLSSFERVVEKLGGRLDILVNNAGINKRGSILDFAQADWDRVLELNLGVAFSMCQYAGKYMVAQRYGRIINIASMNSFFGGTNVPAYSAAKGAVVQLAKAVTNEWGKHGITANCIAPGFLETAMTRDMVENREVYETKLSRIPVGRWGVPDDLKGVTVFLASDASRYISGVTIPVDGGYLCK